MSAKTRARFGYLKYNDIPNRIANKEVDAYDVIFTLDTHECILISPELELTPIHSKVYCYESVIEAERDLNAREDSYEGQIVSIISHSAYAAYIVNKDYNDQFYVTPLSTMGEIDYDSLGNRPIINLTGTLSEPINVEELATGLYTINGQYTVSNQLETVFLSAPSNIFYVEKDADATYIKKVGAKDIISYVVTPEGISKSIVATQEYLAEQGYATISYVDAKIEALDYLTREEAETYIADTVASILDTTLDEKIDTKIAQALDENLGKIESTSIIDLF